MSDKNKEPKSPRRLPRPRLPNPFDQDVAMEAVGQNELPAALAAALGELAATEPNQIRLGGMVKRAEVAAQVLREAAGSDAPTEVEFAPVTGAQLHDTSKTSEAVADAATILGISTSAEVTLVYAFPSEQGPKGVTLQLMEPDTEDYALISVAAVPSEEGNRDLYVGSADVVGDESTFASEEQVHEAIASADLEDDDITEGFQDQMQASEGRPLTSSELKATALVGQAVLDLQPPK